MNNETRAFILIIFGIYAFTFIAVMVFQKWIKDITPQNRVVEGMAIVLLLSTITFLAEREKISEETVKFILSAITGYIIGTN